MPAAAVLLSALPEVAATLAAVSAARFSAEVSRTALLAAAGHGESRRQRCRTKEPHSSVSHSPPPLFVSVLPVSIGGKTLSVNREAYLPACCADYRACKVKMCKVKTGCSPNSGKTTGILCLPTVGLEPTRPCEQQILSLHRLPFRHVGLPAEYSISGAAIQGLFAQAK